MARPSLTSVPLAPARDEVGNHFREFRLTSDGRRVAAYAVDDRSPVEFWYDQDRPGELSELLAVVISHAGGWTVCATLGRAASPRAVWESVFALRALMQGTNDGRRL